VARIPQEKNGQPIIELPHERAFDEWLAANHDSPAGVWLKIAKKSSPHETVTHPEALEIALTYGWIDGQRQPYDDDYFLQRFVRRTPRSKWSQVNRKKVEELIAAGRMKPSGLEQVEKAKADGRWEAAYPPQSQAAVPPDLQAALDANPEAKAFFDTLRGQRRYAFLFRLHNVVRPETRARRIANYIELLSAGKTLLD
jgi:uncharacterized protein YdeI (YjbR/CyaY-like superfamily)